MGFLDWLFRGRKDAAKDDDATPKTFPWDAHPSIYEHIKAHIRPGQNGLAEGGDTLPDEERIAGKSQVRWAAGAMDGVFSHHVGAGKHDDDAESLVSLIREYCAAPTVANKAKVYEFLVEKDTLGLIDPVIKRITQEAGINHGRLYDLCMSLAKESPDRGPVKFGIAILGLYREAGNHELFHTLGRNDEFTLFCAVALSNAVENPEAELWALAKQVDGWGRIHIVERLAGTENPEIKDWLLRDGYKNSVMYEYLAYTCATSGGLLTALDRENVDDELLAAASDILRALIAGGPAEDIDCYEDGAATVELYVGHAGRKAVSLDHFLTVATIRDFLANDEADWDSRRQHGWTPERRAALAGQCSSFIDRPEWRERIVDGLRSEDEVVFFNADGAANVLGIDTWDYHWERLRASPRKSNRWFPVMKACNEARIAGVIALASEHIPTHEIATGPGSEMGLGPGYEVHGCLDFILQELGRFPGHGDGLVRVGLKSPVVRNRNMALRALAEWGKDRWPEGMEAALAESIAVEPDDDVRGRMEKVAAGGSFD